MQLCELLLLKKQRGPPINIAKTIKVALCAEFNFFGKR